MTHDDDCAYPYAPCKGHVTHQTILRVSGPEAAGPPGAGSQAEANAVVRRPKSHIRLIVPRVRNK